MRLTTLYTTTASAATILSEVFYDAAGADDGYGFVELAGEPGTPLDGLQLAGVNGYNGAIGPVIELAGVIGPDGLFLVADQTGDGSTFVAGSDLLSNFDFSFPDGIDTATYKLPANNLVCLREPHVHVMITKKDKFIPLRTRL